MGILFAVSLAVAVRGVGLCKPSIRRYCSIRIGRNVMVSQVKVGIFVFAIAISVASALTVLSKIA